MKKTWCKGGKPSLITVKKETDNPILNSLDVSKHKTKLERDITE